MNQAPLFSLPESRPLRVVLDVTYDPETPYEMCLQRLECGHVLRKHRTVRNFSVARVRCPECAKEGRR